MVRRETPTVKVLRANQKNDKFIYTTTVELDPKSHNKDGLLGPDSIMVVYMGVSENKGCRYFESLQ